VLRGYDAVLGTVKGDAIEKSIGILKPAARSSRWSGRWTRIRSRSPAQLRPDLRVRLMSRKIMRLAKKRDVAYSFLFARPDGAQLAEIGKLLEAERIRPVIDKVFPFEQAKEALDYLAQGHSKGKIVRMAHPTVSRIQMWHFPLTPLENPQMMRRRRNDVNQRPWRNRCSK
jgi:NADPH:quinone reductase-like Zn-dependent oxidoreductase